MLALIAPALWWANLTRLADMLAEVEAGNRPMPSGLADIEGELPVLAWPKV